MPDSAQSTSCSFIPLKSFSSQFLKALAKVPNQYSSFSLHGLSANFSTSNQTLLQFQSPLGSDVSFLQTIPLLPLPSLCVHVPMRIIHCLSVTYLFWASQFPSLHREHKKQRRNLTHRHKKDTAPLCRQKPFCTPDLQPKFKLHHIHANGTRRFGFKTTGRNVMFKEESISPAWKQLRTCPVHIIGHIFNWFNLYYLGNASEVRSIPRVAAEALQRHCRVSPSTLTFSHSLNETACNSHCPCTCVSHDNQVQQQQQIPHLLWERVKGTSSGYGIPHLVRILLG